MLTILTGKDNKVLRTPARKVEVFDDKLKDTVALMTETMLNPDGQDVTGIGLAAPQVGIPEQIIIVTLNVNSRKKHKIIHMINPEIIQESKSNSSYEEGCLSLPGAYGRVERPAKVKVRWQNQEGNLCERKFDGWDARVFLHEYYHLIGKLFIDYLDEDERSTLVERHKL